MSGKTLNYNKVEINKNKFHGSKQSIVLDSVKINRIVTSDKSKHSEKALNILLVTQMMVLLDLYILYCLK